METFVVRVWTPAETRADEPFELHGVVEHVGSAEAHRFRGPGELLELLRTKREPTASVRTKEED
jgi:hypothetical protein